MYTRYHNTLVFTIIKRNPYKSEICNLNKNYINNNTFNHLELFYRMFLSLL